MRQSNIARIEVFKIKKCDDALCHAVSVDRIGAIVKVTDCTVLTKEMRTVELQTATQARFELSCFSTPSGGSQRGQIEPGVNIVNPFLMGSLTVVPAAVCVLLRS